MTTDTETKRPYAIRLLVYVMLVTSVAAAFLFNDWLWRTTRERLLPVWMPLVPVATFTVFVVVYTIDRWLLVRRHHFPPLRAFFQVAVAVTFLALLWPQQATKLRQAKAGPRGTENSSQHLLDHKDPIVRAAACELIGYRQQTELQSRLETLATSDGSSQVRTACRAALEKLRADHATPPPPLW